MENKIYPILAGKSIISTKSGRDFFYQHPTIYKQESSYLFEQELIVQGRNAGLEDEKELIEHAIKNGYWSDAEEDELSQLDWLIGKYNSSLKSISDPNNRKLVKSKITDTEVEIKELKEKRDQIIAHSLENFVHKQSSIKLLKSFLFKDEQCSVSIESADLNDLYENFIEEYQSLSNQDNILNCCFSPNYWELFNVYHSNPYNIFSKDIYTITIFQKSLLLYSTILKNRLDSGQLPDNIRNNPVAIYNYDPDKSVPTNNFNTRQFVADKGGEENMTAEDKLT